MDNIKDFANALSSNSYLKVSEKVQIVDFITDLKDMNEKYGNVDYSNLIYNLKDLKIKNKTGNEVAGYSIKDNTIYLDMPSVEDKWRVNLYKALLQCSITDRRQDKIKHGLIDPKGGNYALNEAITQRYLDLMLENSENDKLDFELNIFAKMQEIVDLDKILNAYFKADYESLALEFQNYKVNLPMLSQKYDRIMDLNLDINDLSLGDARLISDVERLLMNAFAQKLMVEEVEKDSIDRFENNIITVGTVNAYSKEDKEIYEGLNSNSIYFNMLMNGVNMSKNVSKTV